MVNLENLEPLAKTVKDELKDLISISGNVSMVLPSRKEGDGQNNVQVSPYQPSQSKPNSKKFPTSTAPNSTHIAVFLSQFENSKITMQ